MNIIFVSPPLAGKGTQSNNLKNILGIPHISTGQLLRNIVKKKNELSDSIQKIMDEGKLVSDSLMEELIKIRIIKKDCEKGYILDGFPRNVMQAKIYDELLKSLGQTLDYVFVLDVSFETALKRLNGRLSCSKCGAIYNNLISKSSLENLCHVCKNPLVQREDDKEGTLEVRFKQYEEKTKPLIKYYMNQNKVYKLDSSKDSSLVTKDILNILGEKYD
ncbi:MAG: adenylate kinase family protein [Bacilli bacterium]